MPPSCLYSECIDSQNTDLGKEGPLQTLKSVLSSLKPENMPCSYFCQLFAFPLLLLLTMFVFLITPSQESILFCHF